MISLFITAFSCSRVEIICRLRDAIPAQRSDTQHACRLFETKSNRDRSFPRWGNDVILCCLLARHRGQRLTWSSGARIQMQAMRTPIKFRSIILVEPILNPHPGNDYEHLRTRLVRSAYKRKDVWSNREEAATYFRNTVQWHPRVLDIFIVSVP